ncbi:unnamed protein product [Zymoseptoria tritici ST99CH_1A5]|uniref:Long chronological lifespan protein 2 n=3 Tax=Zymoseptoria tritici TaxID=1047171 RepID=A0A1X7RTP7_ZYMT9|nr:unnamed protein product [Zymoseptoria tritici ST99CH_3D7]SMR52712.1 unnamed protein product [Zymoseptoria tritici ST99CH_1E4]SMY24463.1 unnamed protein product [Zymoseptoria tritici ST99CH_1A5]
MQISQLIFILLSAASTALADGTCYDNASGRDPNPDAYGDCLFGHDKLGNPLYLPCAGDSPCLIPGKPCHVDYKRNVHQALCFRQKTEPYPDKN